MKKLLLSIPLIMVAQSMYCEDSQMPSASSTASFTQNNSSSENSESTRTPQAPAGTQEKNPTTNISAFHDPEFITRLESLIEKTLAAQQKLGSKQEEPVYRRVLTSAADGSVNVIKTFAAYSEEPQTYGETFKESAVFLASDLATFFLLDQANKEVEGMDKGQLKEGLACAIKTVSYLAMAHIGVMTAKVCIAGQGLGTEWYRYFIKQ